MVTKKYQYFWNIIEEYNVLMKEAIKGPDCTNPTICKGACCSIKIDIPKELAEEYVRLGFATENDFVRSSVFSFQLRFDENTGKCFLFDKDINGCRVHHSGRKPPQCWIYPTNFKTKRNDIIRCKRAEGWEIIDQEKAIVAEKLLQKYNFLCQVEADQETKRIYKRLSSSTAELETELKKIAPSRLGGFKDQWDSIGILSAEGFSLQMKKFCIMYNKACVYPKSNFLECQSICRIVRKQLILHLQTYLISVIKKEGPDVNGEYPLMKLFNSQFILEAFS